MGWFQAQGPGQFGVPDRPGPQVAGQLEGHPEQHEPAGHRGRRDAPLEGAGPVAEAAVPGGEFHHLGPGPVIGPDPGDGVGHLLAVGSHVLDGRGAREPGDAGEALQPGQVGGHAGRDDRVPVLARRNGQRHRRARLGPVRASLVRARAIQSGLIRSCHPVDTLGRDLDDGAGKTVIGNNQVAAAPQHQQRLAALVGVRTAAISSSSVRPPRNGGPGRPGREW